MKRLLWVSAWYVLDIIILFSTMLFPIEERQIEKVTQGFQNNKEIFETVKEYFINLDYEEIISRPRADTVVIDNIRYNLNEDEASYEFSLEYDYYDLFNEFFFFGKDTNFKKIVGGFRGFYFVIDKETYQFDYFVMNVSTSDVNLKVEYYDEHYDEKNSTGVNISLGDKWYIGGYGRIYNDTIGEKEVLVQSLTMIYLVLMAFLTLYIFCGWLYYFIKFLLKLCKKRNA